MSHHISSVRPRAGRESVTSSTAREILVWFILSDPLDHTFPAQLGPGDMALSEEGNIWLYNGLRWNLLIHSEAPDSEQTEVRNIRVLTETNRVEVQRKRNV